MTTTSDRQTEDGNDVGGLLLGCLFCRICREARLLLLAMYRDDKTLYVCLGVVVTTSTRPG